jgi:hypothetical protein
LARWRKSPLVHSALQGQKNLCYKIAHHGSERKTVDLGMRGFTNGFSITEAVEPQDPPQEL